ncbi:hypothetical protein V5799_008563 [Amblyomma americanum]|uniref:Uncharacterized protein n=1 Tax=Amblyomma americanum TaxID=6943 RepID=A0AAQ4FCW9_AMBAM
MICLGLAPSGVPIPVASLRGSGSGRLSLAQYRGGHYSRCAAAPQPLALDRSASFFRVLQRIPSLNHRILLSRLQAKK